MGAGSKACSVWAYARFFMGAEGIEPPPHGFTARCPPMGPRARHSVYLWVRPACEVSRRGPPLLQLRQLRHVH